MVIVSITSYGRGGGGQHLLVAMVVLCGTYGGVNARVWRARDVKRRRIVEPRPTGNLGMFLRTAFQRHQIEFILTYEKNIARAVSYYLH